METVELVENCQFFFMVYFANKKLVEIHSCFILLLILETKIEVYYENCHVTRFLLS